MKEVVTELNEKLASLVESMGYEFVGVELRRQGGSSLLRIFIDNANGIKVTDCSLVSRQVSAMLDVDDPIKGKYTLEVSSPGLNRPLFEFHQYQKQVGQRIRVRLYVPIDNQRNFVGVLLRADDNEIHLRDESKEMVLSFSNIEKANVIADI